MFGFVTCFLTRAVVFDEISPYKGFCWDLRLRGGYSSAVMSRGGDYIYVYMYIYIYISLSLSLSLGPAQQLCTWGSSTGNCSTSFGDLYEYWVLGP